MTLIALDLEKDRLSLFGFLASNPTAVYHSGSWYRFVYALPLGASLTPCNFRGLRFGELSQNLEALELTGWRLARPNPIAWAGADLLEVLDDLGNDQLRKARQGTGLDFSGWLLDRVIHGISTEEDTNQLIRLLFVAGYDLDSLIGVFSSLARSTSLSRHFIQESRKLYREGAEC